MEHGIAVASTRDRVPPAPGVLGRHARSLVRLEPRTGDTGSAVRVALAVAIPAAVLLAVGRPELTVYAVFGAFTAMYGRADRARARTRHQLGAMGLLLGGVAIGVVASSTELAGGRLVAVEAAFAAVASIVADRSGLRPRGPFFGLFALGACAWTPLSVSPAAAVLVAASTALLALVIARVGGRRGSGTTMTSEPFRWRTSARTAALYAAAVSLAGALSLLAGIGHPIWAMAAAAVPLSASGARQQVLRGAHRILGTVAGVGVAALVLLPFPPHSPTTTVLLLVLLQFAAELLMTRNYGLALVFFTPLILLMTQLAHPIDPLVLLRDRALETVLGALVGMGVASTALLRRPSSPGGRRPGSGSRTGSRRAQRPWSGSAAVPVARSRSFTRSGNCGRP